MMNTVLKTHSIAVAIGVGFFCLQVSANPLRVSDPISMDRGVQAAVRADYLTALGIFQVQAAQGEAVAQYNLGLMYLNGLGVPLNLVQARYWLKQSAEQGYSKAKDVLARIQ
jgi:TPR repeat protein